MAEEADTVQANFKSALNRCEVSKDSGDALIDHGVGTAEDLSLSTKPIQKTTCKLLMDSDN